MKSVTHSSAPTLIWAVAAFFYFYENSLQVSQSVMIDLLLRDLHTHAAALGVLSSFYFIGYALIQIPVGLIIDRYGIRRPLLYAVLCCGFGAVLFAHAHDVYVAGFCRFVIGIGSAFAALSALQIAALYFSKERFALLTGLLLTIGMSGQIFGEAPLHYLVHHFGWRHTMLSLGLFGLVVTGTVYAYVPDRKPSISNTQCIGHQLKAVAKKAQPWLIASYGMFMFTPFLLLVGFWGIPFLVHGCHYSGQEAANLTALLPLGFAIGAPIIGHVSDTCQTRKKPMMVSSLAQTILLALFVCLPHVSWMTHAAIMLLLGVTCSGFLPSFSMMKEITLPEVRGASMGFMNTLNSAGVILFLPLMSMLIGRTATHSPTTYDYQLALCVLPLLSAMAFMLTHIIRESFNLDRT